MTVYYSCKWLIFPNFKPFELAKALHQHQMKLSFTHKNELTKEGYFLMPVTVSVPTPKQLEDFVSEFGEPIGLDNWQETVEEEHTQNEPFNLPIESSQWSMLHNRYVDGLMHFARHNEMIREERD